MALQFLNTNASLLNIQQVFLAIAQGHQMINSFGWGVEYDIDAVTVENYPLLWVYELSDISFENRIQYKFRIHYMDLVDTDQKNELTVQSDANGVLWDIQYLLRDKYEFDIVWGANITPFSEKFNNRVSGKFIELSINIPMSYGVCDAPFQI